MQNKIKSTILIIPQTQEIIVKLYFSIAILFSLVIVSGLGLVYAQSNPPPSECTDMPNETLEEKIEKKECRVNEAQDRIDASTVNAEKLYWIEKLEIRQAALDKLLQQQLEATEPVIPEPVIPEPVIPEPVIPEPVIPEPVTPTPEPTTATPQDLLDIIDEINNLQTTINELRNRLLSLMVVVQEPITYTAPEEIPIINTAEPYAVTNGTSFKIGDTIRVSGLIPTLPEESRIYVNGEPIPLGFNFRAGIYGVNNNYNDDIFDLGCEYPNLEIDHTYHSCDTHDRVTLNEDGTFHSDFEITGEGVAEYGLHFIYVRMELSNLYEFSDGSRYHHTKSNEFLIAPDTNPSSAFVKHSEGTIEPVAGSKFLGCQETPEGCFIPSIITVNVGEKVIFSNTDNVAHTFVSGSPVGGIHDVFDSGLVFAGDSFEWHPTKAGKVPYFCMVHPWMTGNITVVNQ